MDIERLTNSELESQLYKELTFYSEDLEMLSHIIRKELPKRMVYRIISKLYRLRVK